jgi:hypothetical protein
MCEIRDYVVWDLNCKMRMKKKKKTKKARVERVRLYIVKKSKTNQLIVIVKKNTNAAQQID